MSKTVPEILNAAADLIEPAGRWTRKALARNARGTAVDPRKSTAVCWCAAGAIQRVVAGDRDQLQRLLAVVRSVTDFPVQLWNDGLGRTQAEVVAALREAARLAAGEA